MPGETNINTLLKNMIPKLNEGVYVFCTVPDLSGININQVIGTFTEVEGITVILKKEIADSLNLSYSYVAAWITLTIHSSLDAVGLTAAISSALAKENISCNVVAAYYHDHIFVDHGDAENAISILNLISSN